MEEERRNSSEDEHNLQGIWFAAGMAVMIACLERAVVLSIFKQWRVWVFLTLNLLLLAILFTSSSSSPRSKTPSRKHKSDANHGDVQQQKQREITSEYSDEDHGGGGGRSELPLKLGEGGENGDGLLVGREDGDSGDLESTETMLALSNEELNERVEAFIATFRQQYLVDSSDVKLIGVASSSRRYSFHSPAAKCGASAGNLTKTILA